MRNCAILLAILLFLTGCASPQPVDFHVSSADCHIDAGSKAVNCVNVLVTANGGDTIVPPTATSLPSTSTSTIVPSVTASPTPTFVMQLPDIQNDSFEGSYHAEPGGAIFDGWNGWFCDLPYTAYRCEVPKEWNPYQPYMRTPEFKVEEVANRVYKGKRSQHLFCANGVCRAGIFQVLTGLIPGETYTITAMGQMWIADGAEIDPKRPKYDFPCIQRDSKNACIQWGNDLYHSDRATQDDLTAAFMVMGVDLTCNTQAFTGSISWSRDYGSVDGLYDKYAPMQLSFTAQQTCATLFIGGYSRFAKGHNDFYIDSVSIKASGQFPVNTPNPTQATPVSTPQVTPTQIGAPSGTPDVFVGCDGYPCQIKGEGLIFEVLVGLNVRSGYSTSATVVGSYGKGAKVPVWCVMQMDKDDLNEWGSTEQCGQAKSWFAMKVNGTKMMQEAAGPQGR